MNGYARVIGGLVCLALLTGCSGYRTTVTPSIALTEEYTDNVDASSENPESDFITSVTPGLALTTSSPKRELALTYNPSFAYYAETRTDLSTRHNANLTALNRFSRHATLELRDSFTRTDDPYVRRELELERGDEPLEPEDTTRRDNREPFINNAAEATFRYAFGHADSFFVSYMNSILRNDDSTVEDSTRNEPSAGVTYWINPRYGIEARAGYTRADFSLDSDPFNEYVVNTRFIRRFTPHIDVFAEYIHTVMNFQGEEEDYQVYDATVGVDYHLSQATFFSLSGGLFMRDPVESESDTGYVVRGDMARRFSWGALRLSGGTGYRETFFGAENLGFTEFYEGNLAGDYNFTRRITGDGRAGYTHNTYNDENDREDDVITLEAGVNYLIRPWVTSSLRFTHRETESSDAGESYDENRVTLSFTFVPAQPWVFE
jgi:hypothetical protein